MSRHFRILLLVLMWAFSPLLSAHGGSLGEPSHNLPAQPPHSLS